MSILQIAIGLMISGIIAAVSIVGGESMIHAAKVSSIKTAILAVSQKSIEYAQIKGSYNGLSCSGLQGQNLETVNGCATGTGYPSGGAFKSILSEGTMTVNGNPQPPAQNAGSGYIISFIPSDASLTLQDCQVIAGSLASSLANNPLSSACSTTPWRFEYGTQ